MVKRNLKNLAKLQKSKLFLHWSIYAFAVQSIYLNIKCQWRILWS